MRRNNLTIIGKGAWGTALAKVFAAANIVAGKGTAENIDADFCVLAVEAQKLREVINKHKFAAKTVLIIATKGIEQTSLKLMGQVVAEVLPNKYAILSGPNFADEIEAGKPAATTIACADSAALNNIIQKLGTPKFRLYGSDDVISAQVGGAVKNVISIASGICIGKDLGENARAALITRGLDEMARLATALGGKSENLMGLCGFGDLVLTAFSLKSRNTKLGYELAQGNNIKDLIDSRKTAIEGYYSAKSVFELGQKLKLEMPICNAVYYILYNEKGIDQAIYELINRPQN